MAATPNLLFVDDFIGSGEFDDAVDFIPENYTSGAPGIEGTNAGGGSQAHGLAIDAADGVYFITSDHGNHSSIYEEKFGQPLQLSTPLGGFSSTDLANDSVTSLAINASDDILYFTSGTGFYSETFSTTNFTGGTPVELASNLPSSTADADEQIVFDQADHSAYFAAPHATKSFTFTPTNLTKPLTIDQLTKNFIYKVSNVTAAATTANSLNGNVSTVNLGGPGGQLPFSDGEISGITLDSKTDTLYIVTQPVLTPAGANTAGIYSYNISNGNVTTVFSETVTSSTTALTDMTNITVDPTTGAYFISDGADSKTPGIYTGNVANIGVAPTLLFADAGGAGSGNSTAGLAIDPAPTITGAAVTAIDGNSGKTTGTVTTADTVTISVTFNESVNVTGTPALALNDGGSATYQSGSGSSTLLFAYTPASGQNVATLASTGLSGGTIVDLANTSADLTNAGATFAGLRVETTAPSLSVVGETADIVQGAAAATTLLQSGSIDDTNGAGTILSATISIAGAQAGDQLSIAGLSGGTVDGGVITVSGDGSSTLTLSGGDSVAEYESLLESVTYQDAGTDTTTVGHPTRTIDWTVDDGALASNTATSTVTIDRPPVVTNEPTILVTTIVGGTTTSTAGENVLSSPNATDPDGDSLTVTSVDGLSGEVGQPLAGSDGTLTLNSDGSFSYQLTSFSTPTDSFSYTVSDGAGGVTSGTLSFNPCYCAGSRILTDRGEVAVEDLRVGDLAITVSGRRRPIVWLGHRRLDLTRHPDPAAVRPVRVCANAFGEGRPYRDLWLSPGHNVASEGVIMPISSLVNGRSVAQINQGAVEYWHVELDAHDIIIAEGLPAESYLDCGNRTGFANGGAFIEAHPDFAPKYWADTCLPLVKQGPPVTATKARLIARLAAEGQCVVHEDDAHIVVDGRRVEPFRASDTRLAFTLPTGGQEITLHSNVFVPAHTVAESMDTRELGLCVAELQIDGAAVALDCDKTCAIGWREAEFVDGNFARRWTTGATPLPAGSRVVIIVLEGVGHYWQAPSARLAALSATVHQYSRPNSPRG